MRLLFQRSKRLFLTHPFESAEPLITSLTAAMLGVCMSQLFSA